MQVVIRLNRLTAFYESKQYCFLIHFPPEVATALGVAAPKFSGKLSFYQIFGDGYGSKFKKNR